MSTGTAHHLEYTHDASGLVKPTGAALKTQLATLPALNVGDTLQMKDGTLFAVVVEALTDFGYPFDRAACEEIVSVAPTLAECKAKPYARGFFFERYVYATREVITREGIYAEQHLVVAFGEPTWINTPRNSHIICADDYRAHRNHFH